jgi:putative hydrolase of the HAD superfamily
MSRSVTGVIFDWGGTLSLPRAADRPAMWRRAASVICPTRADELARRLCDQEAVFWRRVTATTGSGRLADLVDDVLAEAGIEAEPALVERAIDNYLIGWDSLVEHRSDMRSALERLRRHGLRIGMLSNTHWPRKQHERFLRRDGLLALIDAAVYSSECPWTKPDPRIFRHAAAELGASAPEDVVYVGDRPVDDIEGARRAGMRAILIGDETDAVVPDAVVATLDEAADVVLAWANRRATAGH